MSGLTGPGNTITNTKLISLNTTNLVPESIYVNSIILQTQDTGLTGGTGYVIPIAPPGLNQTVLYSKLQSAFIGCTISPIVTSGYTGYTITWS
jgi:hypothetical protein